MQSPLMQSGLILGGNVCFFLMRIVMFPFVGLTSPGTLMKCVWKQERNQGQLSVTIHPSMSK